MLFLPEKHIFSFPHQSVPRNSSLKSPKLALFNKVNLLNLGRTAAYFLFMCLRITKLLSCFQRHVKVTFCLHRELLTSVGLNADAAHFSATIQLQVCYFPQQQRNLLEALSFPHLVKIQIPSIVCLDTGIFYFKTQQI